jgi:cobalt-zinc-cadmium efflux system membrane fusion protein
MKLDLKFWKAAAGLVLLLAIATAGFFFNVWGGSPFFSVDDRTAGLSVDDHEHPEEDDHIDISAAAVRTLGLNLTEIKLEPYVQRIHLPAIIVEKPGQSGLSITSPIQGVVKQIHRLPGQALNLGDTIFSMQVTDEALEAAQLSLLEILTRLTVTEREIERLDPLTESGAIIGRRKLEMEYQLKQLLSEQSARLQELRLRGLSLEQVQQIIDTRELINEIEVRLNLGVNDAIYTAPEFSSGLPVYTIEKLNVYPGLSVKKGDELCHVANHYELYLQGEAFPADLQAVREAMQQARPITAEIGEGPHRDQLDDLTISYMDNHADPKTQTFPFYLALPNEIVGQRSDPRGGTFLSWKYKPGQRAHLYLPLQQWNDQILLPRDAVVRSGPENFVFRLVNDPAKVPELYRRNWTPADITEEIRWRVLDQAAEWELEAVPVQVLHRDRNHCVVATNGELEPGDLVVDTGAYQVYLAWKLMLSGEGAHDHGHDHQP